MSACARLAWRHLQSANRNRCRKIQPGVTADSNLNWFLNSVDKN